MSQEAVELIRRYYELFALRGEPPWEFHSPDMEFDPTGVMPDLNVIRGKEAAEEALRGYVDTFEEFHIELEEVVAADAEHVVTTVRDGGRMKGGAGEIHNRFSHAWTVRDGRVVRWSSHISPDEAHEAVGLRE